MSQIKKYAVAAISFAMGIGAFIMTQQVAKGHMDGIVEACGKASTDMTAFEEKYHPFEGKLGGAFVCLITQFIYDLVRTDPAGFIAWTTTILTALPVAVLMTVEAGRTGVFGPVRYPTVIGLLGQILGISVVFPAIWVPSYCFGCKDPHGIVSQSRARMAFPVVLLPLVLTFLIFYLDPRSYAWTMTAGILGGPLLPLVNLLCWNMTPPESVDAKAATQTTRTIVQAYSAAGILSLIGWVLIVFAGWLQYGTDPAAWWRDLWTNAHPSVAFMTIDATVLYLGLVSYLFYCSPRSAGEALVFTPLFGPGAACSLVMVQLELDRNAALLSKQKTA